jgi:hypothetical protein
MDLTISRPGIAYVRFTCSKEQYERFTALANNSNLFSSQLAVRVESGGLSSNRVIPVRSLASDNCVERSGRSKGPNHGPGGSRGVNNDRALYGRLPSDDRGAPDYDVGGTGSV